MNRNRDDPPFEMTGGKGDNWHVEGGIRQRIEYHLPPVPPLPDYVPPSFPDLGTLPECGQLPPGSRVPFCRNDTFTGREPQMLTLAQTLFGGEEGRPMLIWQVVAGMVGVGKTQLAVELAYRYGQFLHGVHWIDAAEPDRIPAEIAACGEAMAIRGWPAEQPEQVALTLRAWAAGGPRLVVLDNLEEVAALREWRARLPIGQVRVLLTARRRDWPKDLGLSVLPLDTFTPAESLTFLRRYRPHATDADLGALAEALGHLPLALELAGRYLAGDPDLTVASYLTQLREARSLLDHTAFTGWATEDGSPTRHDLDLRATFALSWQRLEGEPLAQALFRIAGWCAPNQPIPRGLLLAALPGSGEGEEAGEESCRRALRSLVRLSLLTEEMEGAGPLVHPLLAAYAQGQDGDSSGLRALASALASQAGEANDTGIPRDFAPLRPHVEVVAVAAERAGAEEAGVLWNNLGYHLHAVTDLAGARAAYERALAIDESAYGPEHPTVAIRVNNLGGVLRKLGDLAGARAAYERALAIDESAYGPEHPEVATDVNNLGLVLYDLGDLSGARAAIERALAIDEAAYGLEHPTVGTIVNNLGGVLRDMGDLAGARAAFERALAIDEAAYGPEHPRVARDVNNLGRVLQDLGDLSGARAAIERALAIDEAAYGREHPAVARGVNNLGRVLQDLGDLAGARAAYERALAIAEAAYGLEHPTVGTIVNNLGGVLQGLGDLAEARAAIERALAIDEAAYGPEHPEVAGDVNNLGRVLHGLGDLVGARAAYERALAIDEAAYGPEHPAVARDVNNLGSVLRDLGDLAGAQAAIERALAIDEAAYGPEHPTVAIRVNNLGRVLHDLGDLAGARAAYERALPILEKVYGPEHPWTVAAAKNLSNVLRSLGEAQDPET